MKPLLLTIALLFSTPAWARIGEERDQRENSEYSWRNYGGGSGGIDNYIIKANILVFIKKSCLKKFVHG